MHDAIDKMKKIKALRSSKGLQYLLNKAYEIFGNPFYMHDRAFNLIAYSEGVTTDDPVWNEIVSNGTFSPERLTFFKDEFFFDAAACAKKITFMASDKLKYDRLFGKVFNKDHIQVCNVFMVACDRPFDNDDPSLFDAFCDVLTRALSKDDFYKAYGHNCLESLIGELIDGEVKGKELFYTSLVESLYDNLKTNLFLAVVDAGDHELDLHTFENVIKKTQPDYKYYLYSGYILILISSDEKMLDVKRDLYKLNRFFSENKVYAGVSSCFENLFELQKYYYESVEALNRGLKDPKNLNIFLYNNTESVT